ncbi:MAG: glycosyltransferase family 4 protein [Elusimicrobia bacterium]|nr:glycosyltransferase family 4 protein [Elusimicrobiota bacterium]
MKKNLLVVTPHIPRYPENAGDWRIYSICRILSTGFKVFVLPLRYHWNESRYINEFARQGVKILFPGYRGLADFMFLLKEMRFEAVIFEFYSTVYPFIKFLPFCKKVIIDCHELEYLKTVRRDRANKVVRPGSMYAAGRIRELGIYEMADVVITVTDKDRASLKKELGAAEIVTIPTCLDVPAERKGRKNRRDLVFFSFFSVPESDPNTDAVKHFLKSIMPAVKRELPGVRLHVGGYNSEKAGITPDSNVRVDGYIDDVGSYLGGFRVSVCPLRYGAGMKKKILDAMAAGTPVVTTAVGAEGMGLSDGRDVFIARDDRDFIKKTVMLYRDAAVWSRLSEKGYETVRKKYGYPVMEEEILGLLSP